MRLKESTVDGETRVYNAECPTCDDGCMATEWCEGCFSPVCKGCYGEHNQDAPCHICKEYSKRDKYDNLTEEGCGC